MGRAGGHDRFLRIENAFSTEAAAFFFEAERGIGPRLSDSTIAGIRNVARGERHAGWCALHWPVSRFRHNSLSAVLVVSAPRAGTPPTSPR